MEAAAKLEHSSLDVVHNTLNRIQVPPGSLITRLSHLIGRDRTMRGVIAELMQCRLKAIEDLSKTVKTPLPDGVTGEAAEALQRYQVSVQVQLEKVIAELAINKPNYLDVEPVKDVVTTSRELIHNVEELLTDLHHSFVPGDPLRKKVRNSLAEADIALNTLVERSKVLGGKS